MWFGRFFSSWSFFLTVVIFPHITQVEELAEEDRKFISDEYKREVSWAHQLSGV